MTDEELLQQVVQQPKAQFLSPALGPLRPYEPSERIGSVFRDALAAQYRDPKAKARFVESLASLEDQARFGWAFAKGFIEGSDEALQEQVKGILALFLAPAYLQTMAYDAFLAGGALAIHTTRPGTPEREQAMRRLRRYFTENYPLAVGAMDSFKVLAEKLGVVVQELQKAPTVAELATVVGDKIGLILGVQVQQILALTGSPEDQGSALGRKLGYAVVELIMVLIDVYMIIKSAWELGRALKQLTQAALLVQRQLRVVHLEADFEELVRMFAKLDRRAGAEASAETAKSLDHVIEELVKSRSRPKPGGEVNPASLPEEVELRGRLKDFFNDLPAEELGTNPALRTKLETLAHRLYTDCIELVEPYRRLRAKTDAYNALVKKLWPKDFTSLRLDAHHVIEDRAYKRFQTFWRALTPPWNSAEEMPAIAVYYEYHIRSPKTLLQPPPAHDATSLTNQLLKRIGKIESYGTPEELLKAYADFYSSPTPPPGAKLSFKEEQVMIRAKQQLWRQVSPVIEDVQTQLARIRSLQQMSETLSR